MCLYQLSLKTQEVEHLDFATYASLKNKLFCHNGIGWLVERKPNQTT